MALRGHRRVNTPVTRRRRFLLVFGVPRIFASRGVSVALLRSVLRTVASFILTVSVPVARAGVDMSLSPQCVKEVSSFEGGVCPPELIVWVEAAQLTPELITGLLIDLLFCLVIAVGVRFIVRVIRSDERFGT
jgi:hypothetical protein